MKRRSPFTEKWFLLLIIALPVFLLFTSCASAPDTGGEGYVIPDNQTSGYSQQALSTVNVFVSPQARTRTYQKVAVLPFRAPVDLAGASIADLFATEILKTYKYRLVERSQMEQALSEQAAGQKGVTDSVLAIQVGQTLGVQGVIVGTVPEYGMQTVGTKELPAIGLNVRMIDVVDGTTVWSVSNSGVSSEPTSLSAFADKLLKLAVARLQQEWLRAGDTMAMNLGQPQVISYKGSLRGAVLEILPEASFASFTLLRSRSREGSYEEVGSVKSAGSRIQHEDKGLLDLETYYYKVAGVTQGGLSGLPAGPFEITTVGPPDMVEGFSAQSGIIREVPLSWSPLMDPFLKGYRIFRRRDGGKWQDLKSFNTVSASSHTDKRLKDGVTYEYRIIAFNQAGVEGPPSNIMATTKGPPSAVTLLRAVSDQPRKIPLSWQPVDEPEVRGYKIYRSGKEDGAFKEIKKIAGQEVSEFTDSGTGGWRAGSALKDETRYFYRIRAYNVVKVESADSQTVEAVTKPVPVAVRGLKTSRFEVKQVSLSWQRNPEPDIDRYEIFRGEKEGSVKSRIANVPADRTDYTDSDLKDGKDYFYRVLGVDRDGLIGLSSPVVSSRTKPRPKKPTGLAAVQENRSVILTWHENPERDIRHYIILRSGFLSSTTLGEPEKPPFVYTPEKDGTIHFRIKAVDNDDLESDVSDKFGVKVDFGKE